MAGCLIQFSVPQTAYSLEKMNAVGLLEAQNPLKTSSGLDPIVSCYIYKSNTRYTVKTVVKCLSQVHDLAVTSFFILA